MYKQKEQLSNSYAKCCTVKMFWSLHYNKSKISIMASKLWISR